STKYLYLAFVGLVIIDFVHSYDSDEEKEKFVKMVDKLRKLYKEEKLNYENIIKKIYDCANAHIGQPGWVCDSVKDAVFDGDDAMEAISFLMNKSSSWSMGVNDWHNCIYCFENSFGI
ncbi:unnamed protein product, partial [Brassicogethes aeneus]